MESQAFSVGGIFHWVWIALAIILGFGLTVTGCFLVGWCIQAARNRYLEMGRSVAVKRTQQASELARLKAITDLSKKDALVVSKKLVELNAELRRRELEHAAEATTLKRDLAMKQRGVLGHIAQQMGEHLDHQRALEDRHMQERTDLERRIETHREGLARMHEENTRLLRKQDVDAAEILRLSSEKDQLIAKWSEEKELLQNQIADLRSHLSASEARQPMTGALMTLGKGLDDTQRGIAHIMAMLSANQGPQAPAETQTPTDPADAQSRARETAASPIAGVVDDGSGNSASSPGVAAGG